VTAARRAAEDFAEVEHAAAWLAMVGAGRVRPFGSPKPPRLAERAVPVEPLARLVLLVKAWLGR
jgi:hypothetical protein